MTNSRDRRYFKNLANRYAKAIGRLNKDKLGKIGCGLTVRRIRNQEGRNLARMGPSQQRLAILIRELQVKMTQKKAGRDATGRLGDITELVALPDIGLIAKSSMKNDIYKRIEREPQPYINTYLKEFPLITHVNKISRDDPADLFKFTRTKIRPVSDKNFSVLPLPTAPGERLKILEEFIRIEKGEPLTEAQRTSYLTQAGVDPVKINNIIDQAMLKQLGDGTVSLNGQTVSHADLAAAARAASPYGPGGDKSRPVFTITETYDKENAEVLKERRRLDNEWFGLLKRPGGDVDG